MQEAVGRLGHSFLVAVAGFPGERGLWHHADQHVQPSHHRPVHPHLPRDVPPRLHAALRTYRL